MDDLIVSVDNSFLVMYFKGMSIKPVGWMDGVGWINGWDGQVICILVVAASLGYRR
jgi:hypothetical protein